MLTINVKPGWKSGTKITFQREGDQAPNKIPADIVFIIRDKPHALFKREGSDLKYTAKVSLKEVGTEKKNFIALFLLETARKMEIICLDSKNISYLRTWSPLQVAGSRNLGQTFFWHLDS